MKGWGMKWAIFLLGVFFVAGCAKDSNSNSAPQSPNPKTKNESNGSQVLKIFDGSDQSLNNLQAVNVAPGQLFFDFTYEPLRDEELTLPTFGVKSYLIGCKDADIAFGLEVFRSGPDGKLGSPDSFPVFVEQGNIYIIRFNLNLRTSCLGLRYNFAVQSSR